LIKMLSFCFSGYYGYYNIGNLYNKKF